MLDFHLNSDGKFKDSGLGQPDQNLIEFHSTSNGKSDEIGLGQPRSESG